MTFTPRLIRCFRTSLLRWYDALSSSQYVLSRQLGRSFDSCRARWERNISMTSLSVLNYVKLRYSSPSVSRAAIMFTRWLSGL